MESNEERDRFLEEQSRRMGEPVLAFTLARILDGPPVGADLVFLLVGSSALHILPTVQDPSIFGIPLSKKPDTPPTPRALAREAVGAFELVKPQGWWEILTSPKGVIQVSDWKVQTVGDAQTFVSAWKLAWSEPVTP